jgi:hypothetical protein
MEYSHEHRTHTHTRTHTPRHTAPRTDPHDHIGTLDGAVLLCVDALDLPILLPLCVYLSVSGLSNASELQEYLAVAG